MGDYAKAVEVKDIQPSTMKAVEVNGKKICLANVEGKYYAIGNVCTHLGRQIHEMASDWDYCLFMRILASASGSICLSPARSITTLSIIPPVNCAPALYSSLTGEAESRPISKPSSSE
jgi:hypothetical protein